MSKKYFFCFFLCLEVDKRDDDPWDPMDPRCRRTEALNPSSFHCCLSRELYLFVCFESCVCACV